MSGIDARELLERDLDEEFEMDEISEKPKRTRTRTRSSSTDSHENRDADFYDQDDKVPTRTRSTTPPRHIVKYKSSDEDTGETRSSSLFETKHTADKQQAIRAQQAQLEIEQRRLAQEREQLAAQRRINELEQEAARKRIAEEEKRLRIARYNQNQTQLLNQAEQARLTGLTFARVQNFDTAIIEFQRGISLLEQYHKNWLEREDRNPFSWIDDSGSNPKIQELKLEIANAVYSKGNAIEAKRLYKDLNSSCISPTIIKAKITACDELIALQAKDILHTVSMQNLNFRSQLVQAKSDLERARQLLTNIHCTSDPQLLYQQERIWWHETHETLNKRCLSLLSTLQYGPLVDYRPTVLQLREFKHNYERANRQELLSRGEFGTYQRVLVVLPELEEQFAAQVEREQREAERQQNIRLQQEIHDSIPYVYDALIIGNLPFALDKLNEIISKAKRITKPEDIVAQVYTPPTEFHASITALESAVLDYRHNAELHCNSHTNRIIEDCQILLTRLNPKYALLKTDLDNLKLHLSVTIKNYWYKFEHINPNQRENAFASQIKQLIINNIEEIGFISRWWYWYSETVRLKSDLHLAHEISRIAETQPNIFRGQPAVLLPMFATAVTVNTEDSIPVATPVYHVGYPSL